MAVAPAPKIIDVTDKHRADTKLPPHRKVIHYTGVDDDGQTIAGEFVFQRLNIARIREMAILNARLNGGLPEDQINEQAKYLNLMLAHLEVSLVKAPEWWKPQDFFDGSIIAAIYEEVLKFEESFREAAARRRSGDIAGGSTEQSQAPA